MHDLAIVMPVYNEAEIISEVIDQWSAYLKILGIDYKLFVYNDGSTDQTYEVLEELKIQYPNLKVCHKNNSGHGPTILSGYYEAMQSKWVFQVDSDNELSPESFKILWNNRHQYQFLIGKRNNRLSPLPRKIISFISRITVWIFYGKGIYDVNSPYRLMKGPFLQQHIDKIPSDTFAPNVILAGIVNRSKLPFLEIDVSHTNRKTGVVSINKFKLLKVSLKSFLQTISFRFTYINRPLDFRQKIDL